MKEPRDDKTEADGHTLETRSTRMRKFIIWALAAASLLGAVSAATAQVFFPYYVPPIAAGPTGVTSAVNG